MTDQYFEEAEEELAIKDCDKLTLNQYVEKVLSQPSIASHSSKYILQAIEYYGKRSVIEDGRELERYRFFDDPFGDGEHAVIGNTEMLNDFVNELRRMVADGGENKRIIWFEGPTATGKSELKRCLVNGIRGYSQTEEGAKYTLEWSIDSFVEGGMTYGGNVPDRTWYKSPVNIHPLSVFPEETRENIISELNEDEKYLTSVKTDIDPFSKEVFDYLQEEYNSFEDIVSDEHLRVRRYYPELGDGIGVLHVEDQGNEKARLAGSWMQGAMEEFATRGRKNAQAFSYDGVLSQGNGTVSIVEDASHHSDVLDKLMNVCEEDIIKLDNKISMDVDSLLMVISNPDLKEQLTQHSDAGQSDPLRALRRRLDRYEFSYLTTVSLEALLIHRLLKGSYDVWEGSAEERMEKATAPIHINNTEISPRTIEAAAMYEVITRLSMETGGADISPVEKALLFEYGKVDASNGNTYKMTDCPQNIFKNEGSEGIPVTYTIKIVVDMIQSEEDVVLPQDVLKEMADGFQNEEVFTSQEDAFYNDLLFDAKDYIIERQKEDVLEGMVGDIEVTEEDVREYIDLLLKWQEAECEENDRYEMREFETRYLGTIKESYMEEAKADSEIVNFRDEIISTLNNYLWGERDDDFEVHDVPLSEMPELHPLLMENDWNMVERVFPDFDKNQWRNPPSDTETEELKEKTIERMVDELEYSEESAEKISTKVVESKKVGP